MYMINNEQFIGYNYGTMIMDTYMQGVHFNYYASVRMRKRGIGSVFVHVSVHA